jgi:hypothetical protein
MTLRNEKMIRRRDDAEIVSFGINMRSQTQEALDLERGPIPRSYIIENAVNLYLQELKKGNITILQNFSTVSSPESSAGDGGRFPSDVRVSDDDALKISNPQHQHATKSHYHHRTLKVDVVPASS